MKKIIYMIELVICCCLIFGITACNYDTNKFVSSGLTAKAITVKTDKDFAFWETFTPEKAKIFTDYATFDEYKIPLVYTENYFENNNLLVFLTKTCSSEKMQFSEILLKGKKLYPLFFKDKIPDDYPLTEDIIYLPYYVELNKSDNYNLGDIIYKFR